MEGEGLMATEERLIDAKGKFELNADDITGHIMCVENGYATVFDRFAKVICTFDLLNAPTVDAVEVVHGRVEEVESVPNYMWRYRCSCCHFDAERWYKYFPNCGAKMDGD